MPFWTKRSLFFHLWLCAMHHKSGERAAIMRQKEKIRLVLKDKGAMTQRQLAQAMYGDDRHAPSIYFALMALVDERVVTKQGERPAVYFLSGNVPAVKTPEQKQKRRRDVLKDVISNESIEKVSRLVEQSDAYGPENRLLTRCLQKFPYNRDPDIVAMKIGLIDITNSTHLSQHKSLISMDQLSRIIAAIPNIDERLEAGDPELVNEIARSNGKINLFSFASKYCCYHNRNLYEKDDYSILDTVLKESLPRYFSDITKAQIQKWQNQFQYASYNDYITRKLDELGITTPYRKRKFDHFVWYKNR